MVSLNERSGKMALSKEKILKNLKSNAAVHVYDCVGSTNDEAKREAAVNKGAHIYAASRQTAGRGRRGHGFYSPEGTGLYMTLSLPVSGKAADIQRLTCAAAVAVCEAAEELGDVKPMIKWVNDIFVDGRKAAGILAELYCREVNTPSAVIIGIGINLKTESFPEDIAATAGNIGDIEPNALCARISDKLIDYYGRLHDNSIIEKYTRRSLCVGRLVTFVRDGKEITAPAVGIDSEGGLIVDIGGERLVLNSGEISVKMNG